MNRRDPLLLLEWLAAIVLAFAVLLALALAARAIAPVLVLFALALVVAFVLDPLVTLSERRLRVPRPIGAPAAYLLVLGGLTLLGFALVRPLLDQAKQLVGLAAGAVRALSDPEAPWYAAAERAGFGSVMTQAVAALVLQLRSMGDDAARELVVMARSVGTSLIELLLVFVVGFYMLTARPGLTSLLPWLSPAQKATVASIEPEVRETLARYLRARLFLSTLVGLLVGLAALLIGLPFPAVLGTFAGILELIPFLGPLLGAVPALAVAAVEGPLWRVVATAVAFIVIQQLEGNILAPKITADAVRLHPLLVIFAVLSASQVAGVWGALLVTPLLGCAVAGIRRARTLAEAPSGQAFGPPSGRSMMEEIRTEEKSTWQRT